MATLYDSASTGRKLAVAFVIFAILVILWEAVSALFVRTPGQQSIQFSYYLSADLALKNVPPVAIEPIPIDTSVRPVYSIERATGELAFSFPDTAYVYKIEEPRERLTTVEDAVRTAARLGFESSCISLDEYFKSDPALDRCTFEGDEYTWVRSQGTKTLKFNKSSQEWRLETDNFNNIDVKTVGSLNRDFSTYINIGATIARELGFSNSAGLNSPYVEYVPADLNTSGDFFKPERDSQARFMFIEVYRNLLLAQPKTKQELEKITSDKEILDNIPNSLFGNVYSSDPRDGALSLIVGNNGTNLPRDVFSLSFTDFEYATRGVTRGVYPIVTQSEAWAKAQSGRGFLVYLVPENANPLGDYTNLKVTEFIADATKTTLGYYERESWNGFVSPIFVFRGRARLEDGRQANFTIFVDALKRLEN